MQSTKINGKELLLVEVPEEAVRFEVYNDDLLYNELIDVEVKSAARLPTGSYRMALFIFGLIT